MKRPRKTRTVQISTELSVDAGTVWRAVRTPHAFVFVSRPVLRFRPAEQLDRPWEEGDAVTGWLRLFGIVPISKHRIGIESINADRHEMQSHEGGGLVRSWRHLIRVDPIGTSRCRYTDIVEIDAGPSTMVVTGFAQLFYRHRQRRWHKLTALLSAYDAASRASGQTRAHTKNPVE